MTNDNIYLIKEVLNIESEDIAKSLLSQANGDVQTAIEIGMSTLEQRSTNEANPHIIQPSNPLPNQPPNRTNCVGHVSTAISSFYTWTLSWCFSPVWNFLSSIFTIPSRLSILLKSHHIELTDKPNEDKIKLNNIFAFNQEDVLVKTKNSPVSKYVIIVNEDLVFNQEIISYLLLKYTNIYPHICLFCGFHPLLSMGPAIVTDRYMEEVKQVFRPSDSLNSDFIDLIESTVANHVAETTDIQISRQLRREQEETYEKALLKDRETFKKKTEIVETKKSAVDWLNDKKRVRIDRVEDLCKIVFKCPNGKRIVENDIFSKNDKGSDLLNYMYAQSELLDRAEYEIPTHLGIGIRGYTFTETSSLDELGLYPNGVVMVQDLE